MTGPAPAKTLSRADLDWLEAKAEDIRALAGRAAESVIEMGRHLAEVMTRLSRQGFRRWVERSFAFGATTAYKWVAVWTQMEEAAGLPFDRTALYVLTASGVPDSSRQLAIRLAASGQRVTPQVARDLIRADRLPPPTAREAKQYAEETKGPKRTGVRSDVDLTQNHRFLWMALADLFARSARVELRRIDDLDEDATLRVGGGSGDVDRGGMLPLVVTAYPHGGGDPETFVSPESFEVAVIQASGAEPLKRCMGQCKKWRRTYTDFSRRNNAAGGRSPSCKMCERARIAVSPRRAEVVTVSLFDEPADAPAARSAPVPAASPPGPTGGGT